MNSYLFFENNILLYYHFNDSGKEVTSHVIKPEFENKNIEKPFLVMLQLMKELPLEQRIKYIEDNFEGLQINKLAYYFKNRHVTVGDPTSPDNLANAIVRAMSKRKLSEDERINTGWPAEEVRNYLMCLTEEHGKFKPLITIADLEYLLRAEFVGFEPTTENRTINIGSKKRRGLLRCVLYNLYVESKSEQRWKFCEMYKRRFAQEIPIESIDRHFGDQVNLPFHLC